MKHTIRDIYVRREVCGFIFRLVMYEIEATVMQCCGVLEWVSAVRIDPFTGEQTVVPFNRWPFSADEETGVLEKLERRTATHVDGLRYGENDW